VSSTALPIQGGYARIDINILQILLLLDLVLGYPLVMMVMMMTMLILVDSSTLCV
jgi:hypothetical protein